TKSKSVEKQGLKSSPRRPQGKGHWREDCKKPYRSKADRLKSEGKSFYFQVGSAAGSSGSTWAIFAEELAEAIALVTASRSDSFSGVTLRSMADQALVDTAAAQALIGVPDLKHLKSAFKEKGFKVHVRYQDDLPFASGVGGRVRPVAKAFVPVSFHGCGVLEFLVLPHPCPPLLPAGFLDFMSAKIDLAANQMTVGTDDATTLDMTKLPSGHRTIGLIGKSPSDFVLDPDLAQKFPSFRIGSESAWATSVSSGSDRWERGGNKLRLVFTKPRRAMPVKKDLSESPVPSSFLEDEMVTTCRFKNPDGIYVEHIFEGSVSDLEDDAKLMPDYWVGHVEFQVTAPPVQDISS
ncbi:unnamed protein product, partial [Prorocentrum cordatum]